MQRANDDLANGFGNVVNRIRSLVARRPPSSRLSSDELPIPAVTGLAGNVAGAIADFDHRGATELLLEAVDALNRDLQVTTPWQLAASDRPADQAKLDALLVQYLVSARTIAAALAPIAPSLSARLLDVLGDPNAPGPPVPRLELSPRH